MSLPSPTYLDTQVAIDQIGDVEAMNGMLTMLQEALTRDVPLIARLLASGEGVQANRVLHALKGFIPIFCAENLCIHVMEVEALSKTGQCAIVGAAYAVLQPKLATLLDEVNTYLQHSSNAT